jgi:ribosomal protein L7Ae-like RNA K-turn-binding protein
MQQFIIAFLERLSYHTEEVFQHLKVPYAVVANYQGLGSIFSLQNTIRMERLIWK